MKNTTTTTKNEIINIVKKNCTLVDEGTGHELSSIYESRREVIVVTDDTPWVLKLDKSTLMVTVYFKDASSYEWDPLNNVEDIDISYLLDTDHTNEFLPSTVDVGIELDPNDVLASIKWDIAKHCSSQNELKELRTSVACDRCISQFGRCAPNCDKLF
jgi:hypothetical protein